MILLNFKLIIDIILKEFYQRLIFAQHCGMTFILYVTSGVFMINMQN